MKILHLLASGQTGGIETLCKDYANFSHLDNTFLFIWKSGCITDEMKKNNDDVIELHSSKKNILGTITKILGICKRKKIDVVIVHHAAPVAHLCLMIIKTLYPHIKTIAYAHGNASDMCRIKEKRSLFFRRLILSKSLKRVNKVIAISKSVRDSLVDYLKIPENKISVIYNGINLEKFTSNVEYKDSTLNLIYVGRLIEQKGVQLTLEALAMLPLDMKFKFKIVGEGIYKPVLQSIVKEKGLQDKVEFLGNRRDVPELLSKADIFVHMPVWEEGFGITVVEAMALGLVCVCAKSGAIPEIIEHNVDGFLVDKNDPTLLANMIKDLRNLDTKEVEKIRKAAVQSANKFSITNYARKVDQLIKEV